MQCHRGFTLVEIMIALVLGTVLIAGLISVFVNNRKTAQITEARIEMQQAAQFAIDEIARDARMAGFLGCTRSVNIMADAAPTTDISATAISGSIVQAGGGFDPAPPLGFQIPANTITPVVGSHVLSIQFGSQQTFQINPMTAPDAPIVLQSNNSGLQKGDLAVISNCQIADLFEISDALGASLQHDGAVNGGSDTLSATYGTAAINNQAQVMQFHSNVYFLADTGRTNASGDAIQSLYIQTLPFDSQPLELIEGVEVFRVRFGLREEGSNDIEFTTADQIAGRESEIVSIQIGVLMQSHDLVLDEIDNNSYEITGLQINPAANPAANEHAADRRLRMSFNTTINIRNRRE